VAATGGRPEGGTGSHTIVGMTPEEMADFVHRPAITRPNTMKRSEAYENNDM
jgi:hypothetical protein